METHNIICFERMTKEFDTIFDYTFQEESKLKLFNITMIQSEHGINIDQTYDIKIIPYKNIGQQRQNNNYSFRNRLFH